MDLRSISGFDNYLGKLSKEEKNIVNKMYLNEIKIYWDNYYNSLLQLVKDRDIDYHLLAKSLDYYSQEISNKKFVQTRSDRNGFKPDNLIFSSNYIDEAVNLIMSKKKILESKIFQWGYANISKGFHFFTKKIAEAEKNLELIVNNTEECLSLSQLTELQYRAQGKKYFNKYLIKLPFIVFYNYKILNKTDFYCVSEIALSIKEIFHQSKVIIVCEVLENDFFPDKKTNNVDSIFVLRCQQNSTKLNPVNPETLKLLCKSLDSYMYDVLRKDDSYKKSGLIT